MKTENSYSTVIFFSLIVLLIVLFVQCSSQSNRADNPDVASENSLKVELTKDDSLSDKVTSIKKQAENGKGMITDTNILISRYQFDSLTNEGLLAHRQNVTATIDDNEFTSISFTLNDLEVNKKTVYSIYATDGEQRIIINYNGKPEPGVYPIIETGDAIYMSKDNKLFKAVKGFINFSQFDLKKNMLSGNFDFVAESDGQPKRQVKVSGGRFTNLDIQ